jgi:hypothetical protein
MYFSLHSLCGSSRTQDGPCNICDARSGTATGVSPSTSVFPCQYHSTIAPHSFIHLPPTLYNVSLPVLQFSPVSITPPLLNTHPSTYHPRCIMFLSQHFRFPLSVTLHHCSILIHLSHKLNSLSKCKLHCKLHKQPLWSKVLFGKLITSDSHKVSHIF